MTQSNIEPTTLIRRRKAALAGAGLSGSDIAREVGVTRATVSLVILGRSRNPAVRAAMARMCEVSEEYLFPPQVEDAAVTAAA